ncbi:hypothetical protein GYMLUDRAFT_38477 [Collybiopsis luxurians FD-317 M1]|nr:hypothetical protein GYMLUDRAFT_38477 [Collybiopsis luxurians FD-317 M1]
MTTVQLITLVFLTSYIRSVHGSCNSEFQDCASVTDYGLIVGVVIGVVAFISIVSVAFALWRRNRIRRFQREYVQNARYEASTVPVPYPIQQEYPSHIPIQPPEPPEATYRPHDAYH